MRFKDAEELVLVGNTFSVDDASLRGVGNALGADDERLQSVRSGHVEQRRCGQSDDDAQLAGSLRDELRFLQQFPV